MKIGIAGAMSLDLLQIDYKGAKPPKGYPFPFISHIINALIDQGHQVVAYTTSEGIKEPQVFEGKNLTLCVGRREAHAGRDMFKSERQDLVELMQKYPADIINAQWSYEFAWAAVDSGLPTVVTLRDHAYTIMRYNFDVFRVMRWLMNNIVIRKAKYLITNSEYLKSLLSKTNQRKVEVVNNFYPKGLEQHFEQKQEKENYIISVNNFFDERKNIGNGMKAFAELRSKYPDLKYYIVGHGMDEGSEAYQFAKNHKIVNGIVFVGRKPYPETMQLIKKAKVFLHPSREESFGNVILEAMVLGTPVVGGEKSGNVPYLLDKGKVGLLDRKSVV